LTSGADTLRAIARSMAEPGAPPPPAGTDATALAWALKDLCHEAWNSEPALAVRAARAVGVLAAQAEASDGTPLAALAAWTAGIAALIGAEMAQAVACFDAAAAAFRGAGLDDAAAQTQVPKLMALAMLGRHDEAAACGESAQRELRALGNLRAAARISQNLGNLQLQRDDYRAAARHCREAAVLFARLGEHAASVSADISLGDALAALGDFDEALHIYARARMRAANQGLGMQLALLDESVAGVDLARGRYRDALAGLASACRRYAALAMPQFEAIAEKALADAYLELRLLPEALALFDAAVAKFRRLSLPDEEAWALAQRGRTQALLGLRASADSLAAASALFAAQDNAVGAAAVALSRAELALAEDDADAAADWARQAADGFAAAGQADGGARAEVVHAQSLLQRGRTAEAAAQFDATLAQARTHRQLQVQVRCHVGQGLAAQAGGNAAAAEEAFESAIALLEEQRRALPGDELRSAFLTDHLRPYQERLRAAMAGGSADAVLLQLERFRARAFGELLDGADGSSRQPADAGDERTPALRERLNWLYRTVQRQQDEGETSSALQGELVETERALLELARRRRLSSASTSQPAAATTPHVDIDALRAALGEGDALVEYGVLDDELFACIVRRDGVRLQRRLASWREAQEALRSARFQIESLRHGAAPVQRHMDVLTQRSQARMAVLHRLVWAPLRGALQGCMRVLLVPHAQLGALPFAALADGGAPLGERLELAVVGSARAALRGLRRPPAPARTALVLGESSRLPHAAHEATLVAGLYGPQPAGIGTQATLANLRAHAGRADVVHLACHAQFRGDNPRFSALHLHDGAMTVEQAEQLELAACTVVLSACETGSSAVLTGDESIGLVRAFLVAGAARVVASEWPVDDAVAAGFMADFHGALVAGAGPAAALRLAQARTRERHPHPFFWSAFTLHGGW
jgi:CHAT domain-containing protein/tetratricopeptide (TPR) repeat protein